VKGVQPVVRKPASVSLIAALTLLTTIACPAGAAVPAYEIVCDVRQQCIEEVCNSFSEQSSRPLIFIAGDGRLDSISFGIYGDIADVNRSFPLSTGFRLPHPRPIEETGALTYRFKTSGDKPGSLQIDAELPPDPKDSDRLALRTFRYSRFATVNGVAKNVVSSGICFDANDVNYGTTFVSADSQN
jgi:hypothetical protein